MKRCQRRAVGDYAWNWNSLFCAAILTSILGAMVARPCAAHNSLAGTWVVTIEGAPERYRSGKLQLAKSAGGYQGHYQRAMGAANLLRAVIIEGERVRFEVNEARVSSPLQASFEGSLQEGEIRGVVEYVLGERRGQRTFVAVRSTTEAKPVAHNHKADAGAWLADIRYSDKYQRSVLDLLRVQSEKPAPLVVHFHGGGFVQGDKRNFFRRAWVRKYHQEGVAFASVNYPFLKHADNNYFRILRHTEEAIRFLQKYAADYNIDADRISVMGASAGAIISCHVGHGAKLGVASVFARQQPMGTPILTLPKIRADGPPLIVYNTSGRDDRVHHPENATAVAQRCTALGVPCRLLGSKRSGLPRLPEGKAIEDLVMEVFFESWQAEVNAARVQ